MSYTYTKFGTLAAPKLTAGPLKKRLELVHTRLRSYPCDRIDFNVMDLEHDGHNTRHAYLCIGDMSGRLLAMYGSSYGMIDEEPRLWQHFERVLRALKDGRLPREEFAFGGKVLEGFLYYYKNTGDSRALEAAKQIFEAVWEDREKAYALFDPTRHQDCFLGSMAYSMYYELTHDERAREMLLKCDSLMGKFKGGQSHGMITMKRGLMQMVRCTGEMDLAENADAFRRMVIEEKAENPLGDICENFPISTRNEGCSIADWIMLNLQCGLVFDDPKAYAVAENALYNALFLNQFVTGGFGHRAIRKWGYGMEEMQDAWWCCGMNCGDGMAEFARHAVTGHGDEIRVNFLLPGTYTLPDAKVTIVTRWPAAAEAKIIVEDTRGRKVRIRTPEYVKNAKVEKEDHGYEQIYTFKADMGYSLQKWEDQYLLRYGISVMAPMHYRYDGTAYAQEEKNGIPLGYATTRLPSHTFDLVLPEADENGFYHLPHGASNRGGWSWYAEGTHDPLVVEDASTHLPVRFENGEEKTLSFHPVSVFTTTLFVYDIPVLFGKCGEK